MQTVLRDYDYW